VPYLSRREEMSIEKRVEKGGKKEIPIENLPFHEGGEKGLAPLRNKFSSWGGKRRKNQVKRWDALKRLSKMGNPCVDRGVPTCNNLRHTKKGSEHR